MAWEIRVGIRSEPMRINLGGATAPLRGERVPLEPRVPAEVKGKGTMEMWFVGDEP